MNAINYALKGVTINQFATPFEPIGDKYQLNLNIPIHTNYKERSIAVGANVQFLEEEKPFLIAEVLCHFIIKESYWNTITNNRKKDAVLPKELINDLARTAISTARGALCVKTENTPFSGFLLPIIELEEGQGVDVLISQDQ